MADLEARVAALEEWARSVRAEHPPAAAVTEGDWWLLDGVRDRHPGGAIAFGGQVPVGDGQAAWQWEASAPDLLEQEWSGAAARFDALAHPVRLRLLQRILTGSTTTAELADDSELGTTGQLHHHLRALVAGGWLTSTGRGQWAVPAPRVVPLLVIVSATTS